MILLLNNNLIKYENWDNISFAVAVEHRKGCKWSSNDIFLN